MYLLDSNICIYAIKSQSTQVIENITSQDPLNVCTSSVVVSELFYGVYKSAQKERNLKAMTQFLSPISILPYGFKQCEAYGEIRADLESKGIVIGPYDLMIAAHALSIGATLVTNNTKEFERVKSLRVENWAYQ